MAQGLHRHGDALAARAAAQQDAARRGAVAQGRQVARAGQGGRRRVAGDRRGQVVTCGVVRRIVEGGRHRPVRHRGVLGAVVRRQRGDRGGLVAGRDGQHGALVGAPLTPVALDRRAGPAGRADGAAQGQPRRSIAASATSWGLINRCACHAVAALSAGGR